MLNQPAGHLEPAPPRAKRSRRPATRFEPTHLVGIYLWRCDDGTTFLRVAFCGKHTAPNGPPWLDEGIIDAHWLTRSQILGRERDLRSPLVLRCLDDYLAGVRSLRSRRCRTS